jgi:hypothetical protein
MTTVPAAAHLEVIGNLQSVSVLRHRFSPVGTAPDTSLRDSVNQLTTIFYHCMKYPRHFFTTDENADVEHRQGNTGNPRHGVR